MIEEVSAFLKKHLVNKKIDEQQLHAYALAKLKLAKNFINSNR